MRDDCCTGLSGFGDDDGLSNSRVFETKISCKVRVKLAHDRSSEWGEYSMKTASYSLDSLDRF